MPSDGQKLDIRKRSQLQRTRADAAATTEAGHPLPGNWDCYVEKCSKSVQGMPHI
jgi:hypothetical protein